VSGVAYGEVVLVEHVFEDDVLMAVVEVEVWTVEAVVLEVVDEPSELEVVLVEETVELDCVDVPWLVEMLPVLLLPIEIVVETVVEDGDEEEVVWTELEFAGPLESSA
jgi:hypothetical protein